MELNTPKRIKTITSCITPNSDSSVISSSWNYCGVDGSESPASSCGSPEFITQQHNSSNNSNNHEYNLNNSNISNSSNNSDNRENRRGRPRSEVLPTLMFEGTTSPSAIKCGYCNRVFPREKSLQAHLRTHTGERPYTCDYPGCTRAFTQSGQLKTHQRLHTGERPFVCAIAMCQRRFTHANRHCPDHPSGTLKRCDDFIIQSIPEQNSDVIKWLEKYRLEKEERTPTRKTPKRPKKGKDGNNENNFNDNENDSENCPVTPNNQFKSRKGLMVELDMNAGLGTSPLTGKNAKPSPKLLQWQEPLSQDEDNCDDDDDSSDETELVNSSRSTFNPKKRWLREAWQDDLAKPLEPIPSISFNPNQNRPTVLMVASKDKAMPLLEIKNVVTSPPPLQSTSIESPIHQQECSPPILDENRKWLGALALMELATEDGNDKISNHLQNNDQSNMNHHSTSGSNIISNLINNNNSVIQSYTQL